MNHWAHVKISLKIIVTDRNSSAWNIYTSGRQQLSVETQDSSSANNTVLWTSSRTAMCLRDLSGWKSRLQDSMMEDNCQTTRCLLWSVGYRPDRSGVKEWYLTIHSSVFNREKGEAKLSSRSSRKLALTGGSLSRLVNTILCSVEY